MDPGVLSQLAMEIGKEKAACQIFDKCVNLYRRHVFHL